MNDEQQPISEAPVYEATVVTGLESIAADECRQRLSAVNVTTEMGRIIFNYSDDVKNVLTLRAVDNIGVQVLKETVQCFPDNKELLEPFFKELFAKCDWTKPLNIWKTAFDFESFDVKSILQTNTDDTIKKPAFRVTCNRAGEHCFTSNDAASIFGGIVNDCYHWPVSMKQFDLEVILNVKESVVSVLLALTRESLCFRNLVAFGPTTLRSTICHNMLRLAKIETGDIVYDPLCGSGAIPVESAISFPQCFTICSDIHPKAIENTTNNGKQLTGSGINILQMDIKKLPLTNESIDVFVSDLPFGKRMGSKKDNRYLYPVFLSEIARCARPDTGRAVILTQDKKNMNTALAMDKIKDYWKRNRYVFVKVGGLAAGIYYLQRTNKKFS
ncbi:THUMP domain-containing protein 3-like protein [Leptotrombidium deliense]|uniref:THUMP domain-containing protein 3-like protein n=1 Tax=Leptotrombidium deliense TaxID=299467 RepID=A0A443SKJ4_9ACAR|nr:THUMP domain-containing protein 3-like protein [Leptotrombidium deliense]